MEVELRLSGQAQRAGILLRPGGEGGAAGEAGVEIAVERGQTVQGQGRLAVKTRRGAVHSDISISPPGQQGHRLRVISEDDIIEAFLDDHTCLVAPIP